jgi:hypothetical protein
VPFDRQTSHVLALGVYKYFFCLGYFLFVCRVLTLVVTNHAALYIYINLSKIIIHLVNIESNTMESFLFHHDKSMEAIIRRKKQYGKMSKMLNRSS